MHLLFDKFHWGEMALNVLALRRFYIIVSMEDREESIEFSD